MDFQIHTHPYTSTLSPHPKVFWKKTVVLSLCLNKRLERALLVCWACNAICSQTGILLVAQLNSVQRYSHLLFVVHPWGEKKKNSRWVQELFASKNLESFLLAFKASAKHLVYCRFSRLFKYCWEGLPIALSEALRVSFRFCSSPFTDC